MTDWKEAALWIFPPYFIAIYFFGATGFLVITIIVVIILTGNSFQNPKTSTSEQSTDSKKKQKDEIQIVEYSDLVVTRVSTRKRKRWEKKISRYSKLDRKRK